VPDYSLAFEYQGEIHYKTIGVFGSHHNRQSRDDYKTLACKRENITLITVPYWWKRDEQSLMATIKQSRPDLIDQHISEPPIPSKPPKELVDTRPIQLNEGVEWTRNIALTNWLAYPNVEGIRVMWDGVSSLTNEDKSRSIVLPQEIVQMFPSIPLDGILR
jgi:hypothetical protein